jgi:hypothetical protein
MTREEVMKLFVRVNSKGSGKGKGKSCNSDVVITEIKDGISIRFNNQIKSMLKNTPEELCVTINIPDESSNNRLYFLFLTEKEVDKIKTSQDSSTSHLRVWKLQRQGNQCYFAIGDKNKKTKLGKALLPWTNKGFPLKYDTSCMLRYIDEPDYAFCELQKG